MRKITTGTFHATPRMHELIQEVLDSGWIGYGEKSKQFEQDFSAIHDCKYGILSNSGTSALQVALQAMKELHGWADGDEVIVPATTFVATPNIVIHNRMKPVFVDIESQRYGIDPTKIEAAITDRTRAIIPVHLFGQACDMTSVMEIAHARNLRVIEDSCESMFVTHEGASVGSIGDIGCFSMYVAHLLVTGVGGVSTTNNPDYAAKMRSLVNHGLEVDSLNMDDNFAPRPMTGRRFRFETIGHSYRITEFEAALGLAQLDTYEEMLRTRRKNAYHLTAGIRIINKYQGNPIHLPEADHASEHDDEWQHARMMYPIVLNPKKPDTSISQLHVVIDKLHLLSYFTGCNIETRDMLPILGQPAYSYLDPADFPVSRWIEASGFYIGCHQGLTGDDMQYVVDTLSDYFEANK